MTSSGPLRRCGVDGVFTGYTVTVPARQETVAIKPLRKAWIAPPVRLGGSAQAAIEPYPESFASAAAWTLSVPSVVQGTVEDRRLILRWTGDLVRLFIGSELIDDRYYDGRAWQVHLNRFANHLQQALTLSVLRLRKDAPIYLDQAAVLKAGGVEQAASLDAVRIKTEYGVDVRF